jgi:hypothetical protein
MSNGVACDKCGFFFKGHSNVFGKVCTRCGHFIAPLGKPIEDSYDDKHIAAQNAVRAYLTQYMKEKHNADQGK